MKYSLNKPLGIIDLEECSAKNAHNCPFTPMLAWHMAQAYKKFMIFKCIWHASVGASANVFIISNALALKIIIIIMRVQRKK